MLAGLCILCWLCGITRNEPALPCSLNTVPDRVNYLLICIPPIENWHSLRDKWKMSERLI